MLPRHHPMHTCTGVGVCVCVCVYVCVSKEQSQTRECGGKLALLPRLHSWGFKMSM